MPLRILPPQLAEAEVPAIAARPKAPVLTVLPVLAGTSMYQPLASHLSRP